MTTITVSYNNTTCTVGCNDIQPGKDATIQWVNDRPTVSSFILSNFNPANAFSQLPTAQNSWTGVLTTGWIGIATYDIAVTPVTPGRCTVSQRQKVPKITVTVPMPAAKH
jgi:hypothetical protein